MELAFLFLIFLVLCYGIARIDFKLDWNYETGERILWFNDPFDSCTRKFFVLYRKKI